MFLVFLDIRATPRGEGAMSRSGGWVVSLSCHILCFGVIVLFHVYSVLLDFLPVLMSCVIVKVPTFVLSCVVLTSCSHVSSLIVKALTLFLFVCSLSLCNFALVFPGVSHCVDCVGIYTGVICLFGLEV